MSATNKTGLDSGAVHESKQASNEMPTVAVVSSSTAADTIPYPLNSGTDVSNLSGGGLHSVDATDLTKAEWLKVLSSSSVLKAWKGQAEGGLMHINRAPCAALALRGQRLKSEDIEQDLPEFEVADDTYLEIRESKNTLEREMTLKAFTESGIHAALSVGAPGISFGLGKDINWQHGHCSSTMYRESATAIHGFYNFPRVILHLYPDSLELSPQCNHFFEKYGPDCLKPDKRDQILERFTDRFGSILASRITLGGRLCATVDMQTEDKTKISEVKKSLRTQLTATVRGAGLGVESGMTHQQGSEISNRHNQRDEISRSTFETQGGDGLVASSVSAWTASVASYRHWRPIQQDQPQDLLTFIAELAAGTPISDQSSELARCARGKQHHNLNFLDISVKANYSNPPMPYSASDPQAPGNLQSASRRPATSDPPKPTFHCSLRISQPSVVNFVEVKVNRYTASNDHVQYDPLKSFRRDDVQEILPFIVETELRNYTLRQNHKLPRANHIMIKVWLEGFVTWGKGAEEYIDEERGYDIVVLEWPDIEVNSSMHWRLPISRRPQGNFSPPPEPQRIEAKTQLPTTSEIVPETKTRDMVKKKK